MTEFEQPWAVYWHIGEEEAVLYVGSTRSAKSRWNAHRETRASWWTSAVVRIDVAWYESEQQAKQVEREEFDRLRPRFGDRAPARKTLTVQPRCIDRYTIWPKRTKQYPFVPISELEVGRMPCRYNARSPRQGPLNRVRAGNVSDGSGPAQPVYSYIF